MIRSILAATLTMSLATSAFAFDKEAYYNLQQVEVTDITAQSPQTWETLNFEDCNNTIGAKNFSDVPGDFNPVDAFNMANIIIDQIVNTGKKVFAVLEMGRPVVNLAFDRANALPKGLTCWTDLSGWQMPESRVYNVSYKNGYGMNVVNFTYRVMYTAGGSIDGVGQYITNATVMPANVHIGWGFNLTANASVPSVFNMGARTNPVAGMQLDLAWNVKTVMNHNQSTESFAISGANQLVKMK